MNDHADGPFCRFLRFWRETLALSQEELATRLACSQRHISRLETGACRPSESLIDSICNELGLGHRDHNHMRIAGGFAPLHTQANFDDPNLRWLRRAMIMMMRSLDPYPASVVDENANLLMLNRGFVSLFSTVVPPDELAKLTNNYDFMFEKRQTESIVNNWDLTLAAILMAGLQDALFRNDQREIDRIEKLALKNQLPPDWKKQASKLNPMSSFRVQAEFQGRTEAFFNISSTACALGPAAFASDPRLTINVLYPENDAIDLSSLELDKAEHPLLFY